jgi:AcrR family transcriptional regulator
MPDRQRTRGRPSGSTTAATRARLLRAAREVFAEQGYSGAAISDIVARAGVSPPVLYHHFESKAGLYAAATAEVYDAVLGHLEPAVAGLQSFTDCVDRILVESVRIHAADPTMAAFIVSAPVTINAYPELGLLNSHLRRTEAFYERVVAVTGGLSGHSPTASLRVLRILVWGSTRLSAGLPDAAEFAEAVDALRALIGAGSRGSD